jgi:hypothetical protein
MEEAAHAGDFHHLFDGGVGLTDLEGTTVDMQELGGYKAQLGLTDVRPHSQDG